jgi:peptidoglycan/LPS O-acetylase OafA/YrhL
MHTNKRIFGLDLLRFAAIILVLIAHTFYLLSSRNIVYITSTYAAVMGVELFFVLSGFLIGTILVKINEQQNQITFKILKDFWIRRWFRTLPNYYLILVVNLLVVILVTGALPITGLKLLSFFVFMQDIASVEQNQFFGVAWSLSVEEWFYLTFPLLLLLIRLIVKSKQSAVAIVGLIFLVAPLLGRLILAIVSDIPWDGGFRKMTLIRLDSIGMGVLCAYLKYYYQEKWMRLRYWTGLSGLVLLVALLVVLYKTYLVGINFRTGAEIAAPGFFVKTTWFTLLNLSIAMMLPGFYYIKINANGIIPRAITFVSLISYSVYLIHLLIVQLFLSVSGFSSGITKVGGIWAVTILLSAALYYGFESRMTRLRDR